jgi:hypothetical protein
MHWLQGPQTPAGYSEAQCQLASSALHALCYSQKTGPPDLLQDCVTQPSKYPMLFPPHLYVKAIPHPTWLSQSTASPCGCPSTRAPVRRSLWLDPFTPRLLPLSCLPWPILPLAEQLGSCWPASPALKPAGPALEYPPRPLAAAASPAPMPPACCRGWAERCLLGALCSSGDAAGWPAGPSQSRARFPLRGHTCCCCRPCQACSLCSWDAQPRPPAACRHAQGERLSKDAVPLERVNQGSCFMHMIAATFTASKPGALLYAHDSSHLYSE